MDSHSIATFSSSSTSPQLYPLLGFGVHHLVTMRVNAVGKFLDVLRADKQLPLIILVALHQTLLLLITGRGLRARGRRHKHLLHVVHLQFSSSSSGGGEEKKRKIFE